MLVYDNISCATVALECRLDIDLYLKKTADMHTFELFVLNTAMLIHIMILLQDYIARFGHGSAKLAKQAQSKEKVLAKMVASGLTEKVVTDKVSVKNLMFLMADILPTVHI